MGVFKKSFCLDFDFELKMMGLRGAISWQSRLQKRVALSTIATKVRDVEEAARDATNAGDDEGVVGFYFVKPSKVLPSWLLNDFINLSFNQLFARLVSQMETDKTSGTWTPFLSLSVGGISGIKRRDLIRAIPKNRELSDIPKITQVLSHSCLLGSAIFNSWKLEAIPYSSANYMITAYIDCVGRTRSDFSTRAWL
ncbi:hypothetical protein RJ641_031668 [Dillenia turbinata]|uniref:Uncharacterized protein n=1 Tax=Dillenia turbinata TaxID=194707 RepID=A0AAN8ZL66_9MAGN